MTTYAPELVPQRTAPSLGGKMPQKSYGCRKSTGLSRAPIVNSPSPSTQAPALG